MAAGPLAAGSHPPLHYALPSRVKSLRSLWNAAVSPNLAAARVTWTDLLAVTPGREDLSIRGLEIYIALDGDALQAHNSMTEIRGAWYDGNFKIAPGGVSYPSRPRDTSRLSQFQALGGADFSIRVAFPGWYMIVQANMKAQNLSQLFTHYEYDDT